jgi:hypothetical protein
MLAKISAVILSGFLLTLPITGVFAATCGTSKACNAKNEDDCSKQRCTCNKKHHDCSWTRHNDGGGVCNSSQSGGCGS